MARGGHLYKKLLERHRRLRKNPSKKSVSAKPKKGLFSSVKDLLKCPVCSTVMYPPIHQCCNGHAICSECKANVHNSCPTCQKELGNFRCFALEKVAEVLLDAKFHSFSCESTVSYQDRLKHEEICRFRRYNCPYDMTDCAVTGDIASLVAHLTGDHCVRVDEGTSFNHIYNLPNIETEKDTCCFTLITCDSHYFCLHMEAFWLGNACVYIIFMRFMGEETEAEKFRYCLEVGGKGGRIKWEGNPRSIDVSGRTIRNSLDGLFIPRELALSFSGDGQDHKLDVWSNIWSEA